MRSGLTCLLIDDNPNDGVILQRELGSEFPELSFRQAIPYQNSGDWIPTSIQPKLCILDWSVVVEQTLGILDTLEQQWPDMALLIFCRHESLKNRFESERISVRLRICGVATDYTTLLEVARKEIAALISATSVTESPAEREAGSQPRQKAKQTGLWDQLPFGVALICSRTNQILHLNSYLSNLLGLPRNAAPGVRLDHLHPAEAVRKVTTAIRGLRRGLKPRPVEVVVNAAGREPVLMDAIISDGSGQREDSVILYYQDATDRRSLERKLRRVADAVASAESGNEFFQNLVTALARVLEVDIALVCRVKEGAVNAVAASVDGSLKCNVQMPIGGYPAERVIHHHLICVTKDFRKEFPNAGWMRERSVESYMGLPVAGPTGEIIGMIQIMHRKPLSKTKDLRAVLVIFASRVAAEMIRLANEETLRDRERLLREAETISGMGSWEWSVTADRLRISDEGRRIIGRTSVPDTANLEWGFEVIHPDDRTKGRALIDSALRSLGSFDDELRLVRPNGENRWIQIRGKTICDSEGIPSRISGVFLDVSERRKLAKKAEAFSKLGHRLSTAKTKVEAARVILGVAGEIFELEAAAFSLQDQRGADTFGIILTLDTVDGALQEFDSSVPGSPRTPLQESVEKSGPQLILRQPNDPQPNPVPTVPFGVVERSSASIMAVPIRYDQECIGFLSIHSYRYNAYTAEDLPVLQTLAEHSAGALLRVDAEEAARHNHELLRTVVDSLPACVAYADAKQRYVLVNQRYEQWFNCPRSEIEGRLIRDFLPKSIYQASVRHIEQVLQGEPVEYEIGTDPVGGKAQHLHIHYVPHLTSGGNPQGFVVLVTDITSLRFTEMRLKESFALTQSIIDNAAAAVFVKDLTGRYLLVNKRWENVTGVSRKRAIGKRSEQLHSAQVARQLQTNDEGVMESRQSVEIEEVIERDGARRTFLVNKFPLFDTTGKSFGICGIATDITLRKAMEQSLTDTKRRLETAQRIAHLGNWDWEILSNKFWWSTEALRLLGLEVTSVPTRDFVMSRVHQKDVERVKQAVNKCLAENSCYSVSYRIWLPNGNIRIVCEHGEIIASEEDSSRILASTIQDVTEQRLIEDALRYSEEKFRVQYQAMPLPTFTWQFNGTGLTLIEGNPAAWRFSDGLLGMFLGKTAQEIFCERPDIAEDLLRCYQEKSYFARDLLSYRMRTTGKVKQLHAHVNFAAPDLVMLHVDDLTDRLQAEARQRAILQLIPDRLFRFDRHGVFLDFHVNDVEKLLLDKDNIIGRSFRDLLPPETVRIFDRAMVAAESTGIVQVVHYSLVKAGNRHFLKSRVVHCGNSEFLAIVQDIPESEYAEGLQNSP